MMQRSPRALTTVYYPLRANWVAATEMIDPGTISLPRRLWWLLRRAGDHDVAVLNGADRGDQLAAILLRRLRPSLSLVLIDCQWKLETSRGARLLTRLGIKLLEGPRTHYCVASEQEKGSFPANWGVDPSRVFATHWYVGLSEKEASVPVSEQGYVFAGGDSMRDYRALVEAARALPCEVRIVTHLEPPVAELPPNVSFGPQPPDEYLQSLAAASVVVVCLQADTERSAGQSNYLNARALGKLVAVNDTTGVREYMTDGETALIVPSRDPEALAETLSWALDPANRDRVREIIAAGRREVNERFTPEGFVEGLLGIVEQAAQRAGRR
jgi:Glycosyl transferases group 1